MLSYLVRNIYLELQQGICCYMVDTFLIALSGFLSESLPGLHPDFVGPEAYIILEVLLKTHITKLGIRVNT